MKVTTRITSVMLLMIVIAVGCGKDKDPVEPETTTTTPVAETCSDGIKNQDETGVDCGGVCTVCETCSDGIKNQDETDTDCGGICAACPVIAPCTIPVNTGDYPPGYSDKTYSPFTRTNSSGNYEISSGSLSMEFSAKPTSDKIYSTVGITSVSSLENDEVYIYTVIGGTFSYGYVPDHGQQVYVTVVGSDVRIEYCDLNMNSASSGAPKNLKVSVHLLTN